jgi:peroxiredoxin
VITSPLYASPSSNLDPLAKASEQLQESAKTKVGQPLPFFAGWTVGGPRSQPTNLTSFLKKKADRYVVTLCANWCEPCKAGLTKLKAHKAEFKKTNTALLAFVSGSNEEAKALYASHGISWATFVVDRFGNYIPKFSGVAKGSKENIQLPRTFVLDSKGKVLKIIGQEGHDFINLLVGHTP